MNELFKAVSTFLISIFVTVAFCGLASAQDWGYGPVVVYDQRDGRGQASSFAVGEFRNDRGEFGSLNNDSARSVSVPSGYRVRFCSDEDRGGSGNCEEFGEGDHNLRYGGSASYIRVSGSSQGGGWVGTGQRVVSVYEDRDQRGRSQQFGIGRYLNASRGLGNLRNDRASSVNVSRGFRVRICEDEGSNGLGGGRCEEYREGRFNLRYSDTASFIEVQRTGGWGSGGGWDDDPREVTVYSDINQRGSRQGFSVGMYRWIDNQFGALQNDTASSVFVPRGYRVRLCENEAQTRYERCEEFGPGRHNLRYNDIASSVEVRRGGSGWGSGSGNDNGNSVIVYADADQQGTRQEFGVGTYRWLDRQFGALPNDSASSVYVPRGMRVRLCENEGRQSSERCEEYGPGTHNLRYNDAASFVRVWRN